MVLSTEWSQVEVIDLINEGNGFGFILVGGRSTGVVIKSLSPGGVAERDGRLQCGDHLMQIGEVNLLGFSSEQVATVLRQTGTQVRLIVARPVEPAAIDYQTAASLTSIIPTKLLSDPEELLLLTNDKSTGNIEENDTYRHLLQNQTFSTHAANIEVISSGISGVNDEGVTISGYISACHDYVPSALRTPDPDLADLPLPPIPNTSETVIVGTCPKDLDIVPFSVVSPPPTTTLLPLESRMGKPVMHHNFEAFTADKTSDPEGASTTSSNCINSPETETYEVELHKNVYGLGVTVAGYVCEEEDLSGIFVKSIIEGSAAETSTKIQINDRIVAVDGRTLSGVTNHQAVEILRNTDIVVHLTLERFLRGRKYEHLQVALTELKGDMQSQFSLPPSPSIATLSWLPPKSDADSIATDMVIMEYGDTTMPSRETVESNMSNMLDRSEHSSVNSTIPLINGIDQNRACEFNELSILPKTMNTGEAIEYKGSLKTPTNVRTFTDSSIKTAISAPTVSTTSSSSADSVKVAWKSEFPESEIIIAEINKLSGLGISLEGTVDVECGVEKRPHHYIRSILEDGPVGRQGILKPGDELLQVNEHKLQGLNHIEVVRILKELPSRVKLVCARGHTAPSIINTSQNPEAFESRSLLPGGHQSLQNLLGKAQSESSLYTSSTATLTDQRSKSLENVSGLALWSTSITYINIEKTEHGFGFSILDYQDPLDSEGSVIVIRGLIRGGSAEATNEIFPGDRLISVGEHSLHGLNLDDAVTLLKGIPKGFIKLGICRPLSTSDSNMASPMGDPPST